MTSNPLSELRQVAVIGNYLPRQCGIATFTTDLCEAMASAAPDTEIFALAMNDIEQGYDYPPRVRFEISAKDLRSYRHAAEFLNINNVDVVCLQHEYGIFGGPAGSHILGLLRELRMPVVTTLHTVLHRPEPQQRRVLEELAALSDRLVVMSERSARFLQEIYRVPAEKIRIIPHGIPAITAKPEVCKARLGLSGKRVLLTFGLLSENKGIEHVINALRPIVTRHPDVVYVVLGATHPNVLRLSGETYRLRLQRLAREQGVEQHVIFYNQFVTLEELKTFIGACDIYLTPYRNPEQSVSGTLSYVVGNGRVVISTPYWYAEELLADGAGVLVPFDDPEAIASSVLRLLENEHERQTIAAKAYALGRQMLWPVVGQRYLELFNEVRTAPAIVHPARMKTLGEQPRELPPIRLDHLQRLSDDTGILQHAIFAVPNYAEGYTTDDNARALIATTLLENFDMNMARGVQRLSARYLAFLEYAFNPANGRFRNLLDYSRRWLEDQGSDDSHGRALWALGTLIGFGESAPLRDTAAHLFQRALPAAAELAHPRSWAFSMLGLHAYLRRFQGDSGARRIYIQLAEQLFACYQNTATEDWNWFEDQLTYDNARLPQALIIAGLDMERPDFLEAGMSSLRWLIDIHYPDTNHLVPIGCHGWYPRGGPRARFDQQPLEAAAIVAACLAAYRATDDGYWYQQAQQAFEWFLGRNDSGLSLYDPVTGGCHDGLEPGKVNQNRGAESTVAFLIALLELRLAEQPIALDVDGG